MISMRYCLQVGAESHNEKHVNSVHDTLLTELDSLVGHAKLDSIANK